MNKKQKALLLAVLFGLLLFFGFCSCSFFGGKDNVNKPVSELETEIKTTLEKVDKSIDEYGDISGQLTEIKNDLTTILTVTQTINQNISENNTSYYGIQAKDLIIAWFVYYNLAMIWKYFYRKRNGNGKRDS